MALVKYYDESPAKSSKKAKVRVLDEDTYEQSLDKIIQRDFFPELKKIRAQNEYLDATENNDVEKIREISARYQVLHTHTGRHGKEPETPASFETPSTVQWSPGKRTTSSEEGCHDIQTTSKKEKRMDDSSNATLDKFLARHTSEDNASFEEIMEQARLQQKEKYAWLYKKEQEQTINYQQSLDLPKPKEGDELFQAERPAMIDTWTYKNKNALMYCPEGLEVSVKDIIDKKTHTKQEIIYKNTRFTRNPFPDDVCSDSLASAAASKSANQPGKIGVDGNEEKVSSSPHVKGYGFVAATPTVEPGIDASPLMTWGTIDGTPFRLDGSDTPKPATPGPVFKMPEPKKREQLGLALAEKITRKHRKKTREVRAQAAAMISKGPCVNKMERLSSMSPAAKRLASERLGIKIGTDQTLHASYSTPSPSAIGLHTPNAYNTPCTPPTCKNTTPSRNLSLTDDLLKLPKR